MKKNIILLAYILFTAGVFCQSTSVFDASYFNNSNTAPPIKIGKGFHINDIYKQTRACFTPQTSNQSQLVSQQAGGKKTSIRLFYTKTNNEYNLFKSSGGSGKISFLNLFTIGGQELEEFSNKSIQDEERLIFSAKVDFGFYSFDSEPELNPEAKLLVEQKKLKDFVNLFGTHYISGIKKESSITVILTKIESQNGDVKTQSQSVQVDGTIPYKGTGSLEVTSGEVTSRFIGENQFSVSVEINGPPIMPSEIENNVKKVLNGDGANKADAISSIISSAIQNISDPNQSIITQYYYSPFSLYGLEGIYWDNKKQVALSKINKCVIDVYSAKTELEELASESGKAQIKEEIKNNGLRVTESTLQKINTKYDEVIPTYLAYKKKAEKYLDSLEEKYKRCSDVFCPSSSDCCNYDAYLAEIERFQFDKKIDFETQKIIDVVQSNLIEDNKPECALKQKGIVTFSNLSDNPYNIYNNDSYIGTIEGNSSSSVFVEPGIYFYKAVQKSGYLIYPTENKRQANVTQVCEEVNLKIGFND